MVENLQGLKSLLSESVETRILKTSAAVLDCVESIKNSILQVEQDLKMLSEKSSNQKVELESYQEKIDSLSKELGKNNKKLITL